MERGLKEFFGDVENARTVHFAGVCGVGMAGVAALLAGKGWHVSGCDASPEPEMANWLTSKGVLVFSGHDPAHLQSTSSEALVVTPAVSPDAPELLAAKRLNLPIFRRGEVLSELFSHTDGVAVCGAHGKTTTSCWIARLLLSLEENVSWCIGGKTKALGGVAGGTPGGALVVEADESDGTLALYQPKFLVVNTIDPDHLEHFADEEALLECYRAAIRKTTKGIAVCADSQRSLRVINEAISPQVPVILFGFSPEADVQINGDEFFFKGKSLGRFAVEGRHNLLNAAGALALAVLRGHSPEKIFAALPQACSELPARRFEKIAEIDGCEVYADYAHHPAELKAAVEMAKGRGKNIRVLFQPHRYSRTKLLGAQFPKAFKDVSELSLLPVYAASEKPIDGGCIADLFVEFRKQGTSPKLARSMQEAWNGLHPAPNDLVLLAGAGDIIKLGNSPRNTQTLPQAEQNVPFGTKTFFGVGGNARWGIDIDSPLLPELIAQCKAKSIPWQVLGCGANTWVSDFGFDGLVVRTKNCTCKPSREGNCVRVGAGQIGPAFLDWCEREGLSGLEFLEAVPGTIGGWLAMNAGAHGKEIASVVKSIRCLDNCGQEIVLENAECGFGYRTNKGLEGKIALDCVFSLTPALPEEIKANRAAFRAKRIPLAGLRTEGSVFRNPPGTSAGKLLEDAGCKGLQVGGAHVAEFHANIIVLENNASASDVLALVVLMRRKVLKKSGIMLVPEIRGLEGLKDE